MTENKKRKYDHLEEVTDAENPIPPIKIRNDIPVVPAKSPEENDSSKNSILKSLFKKIKAILSKKRTRVALILILLFISNLKFLGLDGECPKVDEKYCLN